MNKYRNIRTEYQGITFDSKKEARRYAELLLLLRANEIHSLELQPRYDLIINGVKCGFYRGDFRYLDRNDVLHVEDAKGGQATATAVYRLKKRLVKAIYNIDITEV